MSDLKTSNLPGSDDRTGESQLRGGSLSKEGPPTDVDRLAKKKLQDTDQVLRTDGEEDTLYEDGLELENDSRPLTGINGRDDS